MLVNRAARLETMEDVDRLWDAVVDVLQAAGFDHAIYLTVAHDFSAPFVRCTVPGLYDDAPPGHDPFLRYACESYRILPLGTDFIDAHPYVTDADRAFVSHAAKVGMRSCLGIPMRLRGSDRFGGFIVGTGLGKSDFMQRVFPRAEEVRLFCLLIHRRIEELTADAAAAPAPARTDFGRPMVAPDLPPSFAALTPRECEVVYLLAQGHSRQEAAEICTISVHTVSDYAKSAYRKLGVHNRAQVAAMIHEGNTAG